MLYMLSAGKEKTFQRWVIRQTAGQIQCSNYEELNLIENQCDACCGIEKKRRFLRLLGINLHIQETTFGSTALQRCDRRRSRPSLMVERYQDLLVWQHVLQTFLQTQIP